MANLSELVQGTLRGAWWPPLRDFLAVGHNDDGTISDAGLAGTDLASSVSDHIANTTNPHTVTKTQVGLSNADNTSDVNKPVSTATQTALDLKSDQTDLDATNTALALKADQTALDATNTTVSGHTTSLATHTTQIAYTNPGVVGNAGDYLVASTAGAPAWVRDRVFDVSHPRFGAVGDGVADDSAAIQAAYDAAVAAGGGTIWLTGDHLCNTPLTASSNVAALVIAADNIRIAGAPGSGMFTTQDATLISIWGMSKTAAYASWTSNEYVDATVYTLSTAVRNSRTLTLATPANAANFAAGDWIWIRTGQILELTGNTHPQAELNRVTASDAGTGVITLEWPLSDTYLLENIDTGGGFTYTSKVGGAGAALPFGVSNVTDRTIENITIEGIYLRNPSTATRNAINGGQASNVRIQDNDLESGASAISPGNMRHVYQLRNRVHLTDPANNNMAVGCAIGMTDVWIGENNITAVTFAHIPVNEGSTNVWIYRNSMWMDGAAAAGQSHIPIQTRAGNVHIHDNQLYGDAGDAGIHISSESSLGGSVIGNYIETSNDAIVVATGRTNGALWTVDNNMTPNGDQFFYAPVIAPGGTLQGQVTWEDQVVSLGRAPGTFMVPRVHVYVDEAFNSDGTDLFYVGWGTFPVATSYSLANAVDVSTIGVKTVAASTNTGIPIDTGKELLAVYNNGGTEPTTGVLDVTVEWVPMSRIV